MAIGAGKTKKIAASGVISTAGKSAIVRAITLLSGTADCSIIIEDGGSGGTEKWKLSLDGTTAAGETATSVAFGDTGILCETDAYGTLTGAAAIAYILYDEIEA